MAVNNCEESCISRILSLGYRKFCIGLVQEEGLIVNCEWLFAIYKNKNSVYSRYEYNIKTKELKMSKRKKKDSEFNLVRNSAIQHNCVIDVSNDGIRYEGNCLNNSPFGSVRLLNESNELIYQGVMIGDSKECFGAEYFPGIDKVEYCGCYYNNERHGFGMLYDRKGNLIYEGGFILGTTDYEKNVIVDDNNERYFHGLIHELVIDEGCGNRMKSDLELCGFENLERIVVKENSLKNLNSLEISNNPKLKCIEIMNGGTLKNFESHKGPFEKVKSVVIESVMMTID